MEEYTLTINPYLIEALKPIYRKQFKGKPASMNRVHFSNWVAAYMYTIAHDMDDDAFWDWENDMIKSASKTLYKRYRKEIDEGL